MINEELVKASVMLMGDFDNDDMEKYSPFIEAAVAGTADMLKDGTDENDPRVVQLAAAKAFRNIARCAAESSSVTSFTAGDVSLTQSGDMLGNSDDYYENALSDCSPLISDSGKAVHDSGFAFLGV